MPTDFMLPELGENVTAGDVVRVLVSPGDTLKKDQAVLELETDKATIEVPSAVAGRVSAVKVKEGERIEVGQVVLTVDDGGAPEAEAPVAAPGPSGGEAIPAATPKPPDTQPAELQDVQTPAGDKPRRGEVVDIKSGSRPAPSAAPQSDAPSGPPAPASPSVRRMARELGVDVARVTGSGPDGRISAEDVQAFVRNAMSGGAPAAAQVQLPDFSRWGEVERKPMSNIRRKTAEHLSHAWNAIPHVTQHDRADLAGVEALRKRHGARAEKAGGKLTVTAVALKIVAAAVRRFPQFNSSVDMARQEIVFKKAVHVGIAVDTERGLLVPVIRDADRKGIVELSIELASLSDKARAGKLSLEEMQGGGITITNLGGIGGTSFTPVVNWPEVAILGISRASQEPVWREATGGEEGGFEARLMLPLSLSYDHRVIDGADAARFLRYVAEGFEQPFTLLL